MAMNFGFILSNNNSTNGLLSSNEADSNTSLLSNNSFQYSSILTATSDYEGENVDAFGGKDIFGTCDLANMIEGIFADAQVETAGSVAFNSFDSLASNSVETAGSVAFAGCGAGISSGADSGFSSVC